MLGGAQERSTFRSQTTFTTTFPDGWVAKALTASGKRDGPGLEPECPSVVVYPSFSRGLPLDPAPQAS